jgi:hypothetical protein
LQIANCKLLIANAFNNKSAICNQQFAMSH